MKKKKKEDCFYGGSAYAEVGKTTALSKTLGQRLTLEEATKLRDALIKTVARCEVAETEPSLTKYNVVILTTFRRSGQITVLTRKRKKPLKRGLGLGRKP